jgi:hypothetical protein
MASPAVADAAEDLIEVGLAHLERVVLRVDRAVVIGEVEGNVIIGLHDQERPIRDGVIEAEDLGQEPRRRSTMSSTTRPLANTSGGQERQLP